MEIDSQNLVFLVSQPRSGSTLLQRMLGGHSELATVGEPWIALHPLYALRETGLQSEYDAQQSCKAVHAFLESIGEDEWYYRAEVARMLGRMYAKVAAVEGKPRVLDKTPRYYLILDELAEMFPDATFILLYRNPLAVLHSILTSWVGTNFERLVLFKDDLLTCPGALLRHAEAYPDRSIAVRYEDLTANPEAELTAICGRLGIPFEPGMENYGGRDAGTFAFGDQVGVGRHDAPVQDSVESWKAGLGTPTHRPLALAYLEALGKPLLEELGYPLTPDLIDTVDGPTPAALPDWTAILDQTPDRLMEQRNALLEEQDRLRNEVTAHAEAVASMRQSYSWRITAPLRMLLGLVRGHPESSEAK